MKTSFKKKNLFYWITTIISSVAFLIPGIGNLLHIPHFAKDMLHLGYPIYFPTILGAWKIAGAMAIVLPNLKRLKEWAYAGMIFDLTGASFSRISSHDEIITVVVPLFIATVVFSSWSLRPENRKL